MNYSTTFRAKGLLDGCTDLLQMASSLEQAAGLLRSMHRDGVTLQEPVHDDYAFLEHGDAAMAARYGMTASDSEQRPRSGRTNPRLTAIKGSKGNEPSKP